MNMNQSAPSATTSELDIHRRSSPRIAKIPHHLPSPVAIHAAVSCGDISCLQTELDQNDYALAKDHLGMAPLHKAVILGHTDVVRFILERFPETINAKDRDGRTALHYAAASTNRNASMIYKLLIRSGGDPRIRDINGKTASYYRVHLLPLPDELMRLTSNKRRGKSVDTIFSPIQRRRPVLLPSVQERITNSLYTGDVNELEQLVYDGYGDSVLGRITWGDDARKFLKSLPHLMDTIKSLHTAVINGDVVTVESCLNDNPSLLKAKDESGLMAVHLAALYNQIGMVEFIIEKYPFVITQKDHFDRSCLHIAAQNKYLELYNKLMEHGADVRAFDLRGRTPENYMRFHEVTSKNIQRYNNLLSDNRSPSVASSTPFNNYRSDGETITISSSSSKNTHLSPPSTMGTMTGPLVDGPTEPQVLEDEPPKEIETESAPIEPEAPIEEPTPIEEHSTEEPQSVVEKNGDDSFEEEVQKLLEAKNDQKAVEPVDVLSGNESSKIPKAVSDPKTKKKTIASDRVRMKKPSQESEPKSSKRVSRITKKKADKSGQESSSDLSIVQSSPSKKLPNSPAKTPSESLMRKRRTTTSKERISMESEGSKKSPSKSTTGYKVSKSSPPAKKSVRLMKEQPEAAAVTKSKSVTIGKVTPNDEPPTGKTNDSSVVQEVAEKIVSVVSEEALSLFSKHSLNEDRMLTPTASRKAIMKEP